MLELLLSELASAAYHAASTVEFFSTLDEERLRSASISRAGELSPIERLAGAARDLSVAPEIAWNTTSTFRIQVGLDTRDYPIDAFTAADPIRSISDSR